MRSDIPDMPDFPSSMTPGRTASITNFLIGIWVLISPFVLGFSNNEIFLWNNVIVGILVMIIAAIRAWGQREMNPNISWVNFVLGIWLIVSPFVFDFQMNAAITWNQVISGVGVAVLAALSVLGRPVAEPPIAP